MCHVGVILCVLNCVLGLIFPYITYSTHAHPKRYKAVVAILGNVLHICLLLFTVVHGSSLLVLNVRAQARNNGADVSPTFNLMLDFYFAHAGFDIPTRHRLEAKEPSASSSSDARVPDSGAASEKQSSPSSARGVSAPEQAAFPALPVFSLDKLSAGEQNDHSDLLAIQSARFTSIISSLSVLAKELTWVSFGDQDSGVGQGLPTDSAGQSTGKNTGKRSNSQSSNARVSRGSSEDNSSPSYHFSREDLHCIIKAEASPVFAENVLRRFRSLLYWGLFCGYVERSLILLSKRNIACAGQCHFEQFHLSRHEKNMARTGNQAAQLMKNVRTMTREQARFCVATATIASCRVEEAFIQHRVAAALCAALPLSFVLVIFCCTCIIACWKIAQRCGKKVQST